MSIFFKKTTDPKLIKKYNLSKDLIQRRLQLLGPKLFKVCASGKAVDEIDLKKRVMLINRKFDLGFVLKDIIKGCQLSEKPTDDEDIKEQTEKVLRKLNKLTSTEIENLEIMEDVISKDLVQNILAPYYVENYYIEDGKLFNKEGKALFVLPTNIDENILKNFLRNTDFFKEKLFKFFKEWAEDKRDVHHFDLSIDLINRNNLENNKGNVTIEDYLVETEPLIDLNDDENFPFESNNAKIETEDELYKRLFSRIFYYIRSVFYN